MTELPPQKELKIAIPIPEFDLMKAKKKMDSIFKVRGNLKDEPYVRIDESDDEEENKGKEESDKGSKKGSETSSLKTDVLSEDEESSNFKPVPNVEFYQ